MSTDITASGWTIIPTALGGALRLCCIPPASSAANSSLIQCLQGEAGALQTKQQQIVLNDRFCGVKFFKPYVVLFTLAPVI